MSFPPVCPSTFPYSRALWAFAHVIFFNTPRHTLLPAPTTTTSFPPRTTAVFWATPVTPGSRYACALRCVLRFRNTTVTCPARGALDGAHSCGIFFSIQRHTCMTTNNRGIFAAVSDTVRTLCFKHLRCRRRDDTKSRGCVTTGSEQWQSRRLPHESLVRQNAALLPAPAAEPPNYPHGDHCTYHTLRDWSHRPPRTAWNAPLPASHSGKLHWQGIAGVARP
jgi:hypothetical protein